MAEFCTLNAAADLIREVAGVSKSSVLQLASAGLLGPVTAIGRTRLVEAAVAQGLAERGCVGDAEVARTVEAFGPLFVIRQTIRAPSGGSSRSRHPTEASAASGSRHDMAPHAWHMLLAATRESIEERFGQAGFIPVVTTVGGYVVECGEGVALIPHAHADAHRFAVRPPGTWAYDFERRWMPTPPGGGRWLWWPSRQPGPTRARARPDGPGSPLRSRHSPRIHAVRNPPKPCDL